MNDPLDRLLDLDAPTPSPGFDDHVAEALAHTNRLEEAALDDLLALDQPVPSAGFDARVQAALGEHRAAKVIPFRRRALPLWIGLAAAAVAAVFVLRQPTDRLPDQDVARMADLELLEAYDEVAWLDGLQDPETFDLVLGLEQLEAP